MRINRQALSLIILLFLGQSLFAQKQLTKHMSLYIPGEYGNNAGSVVWHPTFKRYYTSMIGNKAYPMAVYNEKGAFVEGNFEAGVDLRGLWYNPVAQKIEFNCYAAGGVGHYILNATGEIINFDIDKEGSFQPTTQSVGTYNYKDNLFVFGDDEFVVYTYKSIGGVAQKTINLYLGCSTKKQADELSLDDFEERILTRNTTIVYTGITNSEYGVLGTEQKAIELYDAKTGLMTDKKRLPQDFPTTLFTFFNFSYANNIWWFFNKTDRTWEGYK